MQATRNAATSPQLLKKFLLARLPDEAGFSRYGLAVVVIGLATIIKFGLNWLTGSPVANTTPFLTFFPAVMLVVWYAGIGPGLFSIFLSSISANYFFMEPAFQFRFFSSQEILNLAIFILNNLLIILLCYILRQSLDSTQAELAQRREAELSRDLTEARFRLIQEVTPSSFVILPCIRDAQGRIIDFTWDYINPEAKKTIGLPLEQLRGRRVLELFPATRTSGLFDAYMRVIETNLPSEMEVHFDGEGINRWFRNVIVKSGDGVAVTSIEISQIKKTENERLELLDREQSARQAAEKAGEQLAFLAEASDVLNSSLDYEVTLQNLAQLVVPRLADWCSVYIVDEFGGPPLQIAIAHADPAKVEWALNLQKELEDRYPYNPAETSGLPKVLRTGQSELYSEITDEMLVAASQDEDQLRIMREIGYSALMILPLVARDRVLGALQMVATESGQHYTAADLDFAEELARRAAIAVDNARLYKEAQKAISVRNEFLSVAAHELKTPVTSLRGFSQLLLRRFDRQVELDPIQLRSMVVTIEEQANKMVRLISRLLDLSKLESGKLVLECEPTDLVKLLDGVIKAAQTNTEKHLLELIAPEGLVVPVDPIRFEQVVTNLVDNAIKYSPQGGLIEIKVEREPRSQIVRMSVKDQGLGIPLEHRSHIFQPFYQAHERGYAGLGIGLYITQQIVELHGGEIEVEFGVEHGTNFIICLPDGSVPGSISRQTARDLSLSSTGKKD